MSFGNVLKFSISSPKSSWRVAAQNEWEGAEVSLPKAVSMFTENKAVLADGQYVDQFLYKLDPEMYV